MKNILVITVFAILSTSVTAKTALFGEANAFGQLKASEEGTALQIHGYLSEFGFRGESAVNDSTQAFFELTLGVNLTESWSPFTKAGEMGVKGQFGEAAIFYGDSPLSKTNEFLRLMPNDPDTLSGTFAYSEAERLGLAVGLGGVDGISYRSPKVLDSIELNAALIPAEVEGGETGFSFSGDFREEQAGMSIAFEINGETANTQIVRIIGDVAIGNMRVGGSVQASGNSVLDTSARSIIGYVKLPVVIGQYETRLKCLLAFNNMTNALDESEQQIYASFVEEVPLGPKVSSYSFIELEWDNDLADLTSYGGLGLKIDF